MNQPSALQPAQVADLRARLTAGRLPTDDRALIDLIGELETLKSAICGLQASATARFDRVRRDDEAAQEVPIARQGRGVAAEIALTRRESPHRGAALVGLAKIVTTEMPHTHARMLDGTLSEWRATVLARETACLSVEHRAVIDQKICSDPASLNGVGTRALTGMIHEQAYALDPAAAVKRARRAESERTVGLRPAPDTMTYLTGLLPVAQGVAAYAVLTRDATALKATGDPRSKGALMADLLVSRITGIDMTTGETIDQNPTGAGAEGDAPAAVPGPPPIPMTVNISLSDETLAGGHASADISAEGVTPVPIPAEVARHLIAGAAAADVALWFRRLYRHPATGALIGMSTRQRFRTDGMADFLHQRDRGICRTPYCDAPIRHHDHIAAHQHGGETSTHNGAGLCEACNHAKQSPNWHHQVISKTTERHTITITTPTGQQYQSRAPDPPGARAKGET